MSTKAANPQLLGDIAKADPHKLHHVDTQEKNPLPSPDGKSWTIHPQTL